MVMTELSASDRLLTASIVMATERVATPTAALNAARRTFAAIPSTLVRTMVASRCDVASPPGAVFFSSCCAAM